MGLVVLAASGVADAALYNLNNHWVEVDYWAGVGPNETIVVVDWNDTHGPYLTESHAWGYRWSGDQTVKDALEAIELAGALDMEYGYGGGFVLHADYFDPSIDTDNHRTTDYEGWCWSGSTTDGGLNWEGSGGGLDTEPLAHNQIEGLNWNPGDWTGDNLTIPVPEPATITLVALGGMFLRRRPGMNPAPGGASC